MARRFFSRTILLYFYVLFVNKYIFTVGKAVESYTLFVISRNIQLYFHALFLEAKNVLIVDLQFSEVLENMNTNI